MFINMTSFKSEIAAFTDDDKGGKVLLVYNTWS